MSNEIVSIRDESETLSSTASTGNDANTMHCRPQAFDLTKNFRPRLEIDLWAQGHKHVSHSSPTLASVKPLLEKIKEPSVLLLLGCELLLQQAPFPFEKFKTLVSLEISGISSLTVVPIAISKMTQLQALNLSHLPIHQFPSAQLLSNLTLLRSLVLRGCYNLHSIPPFPHLPVLQCLDLSDLLIETFPFEKESYLNIGELRWLILRGCSRLRSFPEIFYFKKLEVLDLSHCTTLQEIRGIAFLKHRSLQMLDLSCTALPEIGIYNCMELTHLFLRDTKEVSFYANFSTTCRLTAADLSGVQNLKGVFWLKENRDLVVADLSRTEIESTDFLSNNIHLRHLLLRECTKLVNLSEINRLTNLEVLDISGCEILTDLPQYLNNLKNLKELNLSRCICLKELREGLFDDMACLEKLDLSKTNVSHLPSFASLTNLQTLELSHTPVEKLPDLSKLVNLKELLLENCQQLKTVHDIPRLTNLHKPDLSLPGNDRNGLIGVGNLQEKGTAWDCNILQTHLPGIVSNPDEFHLISTFLNDGSGFDRFKYEFKKLEALILNIEKKIKPVLLDKIRSPTTTNKMDTGFIIKFESIHRDLKYILKNIDLLESSSNCRSSEELLHELMNATTSVSNDDFSLDSIDLSELIRVVAKLKLLVPPPKQVGRGEDDAIGNKKKKKKKKIVHTSNKDGEEVILDSNSLDQYLLSSYDSLTDIEQKCLLYFAAFSLPKNGYLDLNVKTLIQLWYGEGFIDPVLYANTIKQSQPTPNQDLNQLDPNPNLEQGTSTYTSLARNNSSGQVSTAKDVEIPNTIDEIALQILEVLQETGFIIPRVGHSYCMNSSVLNFVKAKAKAECFFDFDDKNGELISRFKGSHRACLLKSQAHYPSSCQLWLSYANSSKKQESFENIRTLLQVSESIIDLNLEWFSKMRNLIVIHLGSLNCGDEEHVDVVDLKFLVELTNMKQLRLLSLEGFSAIVKLPDSVCKIISLRMLNLKYCCNLEELSASIGSLRNLTHLDLTHCHLLSMLPKGLMLLSQLEVLKGFVITYEDGGQQHTNACTLRELLKLLNLRKLSLVVNRENFPYSKDLHVFKGMKNLCNLKITWKENTYKGQEPEDAIRYEAPRHSRWKQLKCWKQQTRQSDTEEPLRINRLHDLKKVVMCCFPFEAPPSWIHPRELQKLEKLCVIGGNLKMLPGGSDQNIWSVSTLHLNYLSNLHIDWPILKGIFPNMTFFNSSECPHIQNIPRNLSYWSIEQEYEDNIRRAFRRA